MFHLTEPMDIAKLAYVFSFLVPLLLIIVSCASRKVIEAEPWSRRHFYIGLDLTIYFLTACLTNVADLAKEGAKDDPPKFVWTMLMITVASMMLWVQAAFHQEWEKDTKSPRGQVFVLCGASNGVGLILLFGFIRMKLDGLL